MDTADRMANGTYPIKSQKAAQSAWELRRSSKTYSEDEVVAHIRAMVAKHGLEMPHDEVEPKGTKDSPAEERREAAAQQIPPHGFIWPDGMPDCSLCDRPPNDPVHVNPPRNPQRYGETMLRIEAADKSTNPQMPVRSHAYTPNVNMITGRVLCVGCGENLSNGIHVVGMPAGMVPSSSNSGIWGGMPTGTGGSPFAAGPQLARVKAHLFEPMDGHDGCGLGCGFPLGHELHNELSLRTAVRTLPRRQAADLSDGSAYDQAQRALALVAIADEALDQAQPLLAAALGMPNPDSDDEPTRVEAQVAFVSEIGQKLVFAAPGSTGFDVSHLPREIAAGFQRASAANPYNLWVTGRYVEAERPNRNAAYWSTADLEVGQPSVAHGPINWNHQEKEIIGCIAATELVKVQRQAASDVGSHIVALAAVWGFIYPERARAVQKASEDQKLWYSMECISREVACLAGDCGHVTPYRAYMQQPQTARCQHMLAGMPRRFVDPVFGGGAMIVPPVRPGWANADARVMKQAAALAERQAAAFGDLTTSEAELLVAQLIGTGE